MARLVGYGGDVIHFPLQIHACDVAFTELVDGDTTLTLDTIDYKVGTGSNKNVIDLLMAAGDIIMTDAVGAFDLTPYTMAMIWVKSTLGTAAGDYNLLLDEAIACANGDIVEAIPALTAGVWKVCRVPITTAGLNAIISVGLEYNVDIGADTIWVDEIRVGASVLGTRAWNIDSVANVQDTTSFQDGQAKTFTVTQTEWSGSFEGFKEDGVAPLAIGLNVYLELRESAVATQMWRGEAVITSCRPSSSVDGVVMYSYDFQGIHALEWPTT